MEGWMRAAAGADGDTLGPAEHEPHGHCSNCRAPAVTWHVRVCWTRGIGHQVIFTLSSSLLMLVLSKLISTEYLVGIMWL